MGQVKSGRLPTALAVADAGLVRLGTVTGELPTIASANHRFTVFLARS